MFLKPLHNHIVYPKEGNVDEFTDSLSPCTVTRTLTCTLILRLLSSSL
jgi:hypothetical protein